MVANFRDWLICQLTHSFRTVNRKFDWNPLVGVHMGLMDTLKPIRIECSPDNGLNSCRSYTFKGPMARKTQFMRLSNINMSSLSLPIVPQWLKLGSV